MKMVVMEHVTRHYSLEGKGNPCCEKFQEELWHRFSMTEDGVFYINDGGTDSGTLWGIKFCPWCGEEIVKTESQYQGANI